VREFAPDVVTLDVNMPVMDGLTALHHIMAERPTPVVMVSSLTREGAAAAVEALELGAIDVVGKPGGTVSLDIETCWEEIVGKVRGAASAGARLRRGERAPARRRHRRGTRSSTTASPPTDARPAQVVVVVGISTGGPQTLRRIVPELPAEFPAAVVVVQHMPPAFTASLAKRLGEASAMPVTEAVHNEILLEGHAYVAPGGQHLTLAHSVLGRGIVVNLSRRPYGRAFCPSVDVLFESAAETLGGAAVGVLLTGMGDDGAEGMCRLHERGAPTIAESEESAIVFGMPRAAIERGAAQTVVPAWEVAQAIERAVPRALAHATGAARASAGGVR
jgi:two-component system chemotaxis response regulator CheB